MTAREDVTSISHGAARVLTGARVFLGNDYFGAGNFGDDLSLAGFMHAAVRHPGITITACTAHDLASMRRRFPRIHWLPDADSIRDDATRDADLWLALGDTPFQLDSGPWLLERNERERQRCAALGKPMYLLGVGCESRAAAADPRSRALLASARHVWARDEQSAATLRPFIDPVRLSEGADLAHLGFADESVAPAHEAGVVGLLLAFERRDQFDLHEIELFLGERGARATRWLVQETRALPYLERWILANLAPEAQARLSVMDAPYASSSSDAYLRAFGAPEVVVTSRYHGAMVAAWHGSRIAVVSRSAKLRGIADELGLPTLERAGPRAALDDALAAATSVPRERLRAIRDRAQRMCDAFFRECSMLERAHAVTRATPASVPLPPGSLRATITADVPQNLEAGQTAVIRCTVANRSDSVYTSAPPNPVALCYRWYDARDAAVGAGTWVHTPLPRPLPPGDRVPANARITAPADPGTYTLALTLLQEDVAWFDDLDRASGLRVTVNVDPARADDGDREFYALPLEARRAMTLRAAETRTPLLLRWKAMGASAPDQWQDRAAAAADWLRGAPCVVDLGCGGMTLEHYLEPGQSYVPVDLFARDGRTIVADLEKDPLPAVDADTCALLGVLPYLFEPLTVLRKMRQAFAHAVVSYNTDASVDARLEHGWVNHLDRDGVLRLFRDAGYDVVRERTMARDHLLFELVRSA